MTRRERSSKPPARGAYLTLPPNPDRVETDAELESLVSRLREQDPDAVLGADLFSGAGGLSLGLTQAGINVVFGCDIDPQANETHAHHFPGLTVDWDLGDADTIERIGNLIRKLGIDVLAGGPPCQPFSKAGRSKIRHRVQLGLRDPHDERRDLWQSFVEVAEIGRPRVVIMENVPDMALDREMFILRSMVQRLEVTGYSVNFRIVQTSDHGVPQHRQRLILVALRDHLAYEWPEPVESAVLLNQAIDDLPDVEPGWVGKRALAAGSPYDGPKTAFQRRMREDPHLPSDRVYDHFTRTVRADDLEVFRLMDSKTKYSDLPKRLRRYRSDIFDDKYKRLDWEDLSRTITAHISKDGYWYIHPEYHRTLTVREAARIQTFPDHYRFAGTPTAAFRQIGNAVPPMLGEALGGSVLTSLEHATPSGLGPNEMGELLARAWREFPSEDRPWLKEGNRFQVLVCEHLFARQSGIVGRFGWQKLSNWRTPTQLLSNKDRFVSMAEVIGRGATAVRLLTSLQEMEDLPDSTLSVAEVDKWRNEGVIPPAIADIVSLAGTREETSDDEHPVIVNQPILRVVARYFGIMADAKNRRTDGRLAVARMLGFGSSAREAHLMLLEIGRSICFSSDPQCGRCPLRENCRFSRSQPVVLQEPTKEQDPLF